MNLTPMKINKRKSRSRKHCSLDHTVFTKSLNLSQNPSPERVRTAISLKPKTRFQDYQKCVIITRT